MASQTAFYRAVGVLEKRRRTAARPGFAGVPSLEPDAVAALAAFNPSGDVLELACGSGRWTAELLPYVARLTAVDVSPGLLAVARRLLPEDRRLTLLTRDVFRWRPRRQFDVVFFAYFLCHVPASSFNWFWSWVADALKPNGRFFFVEVPETDLESTAVYKVRGAGTVSDRRLFDARRFRLIDNHYRAERLRARLERLGWRASVRLAGDLLILGSGRRSHVWQASRRCHAEGHLLAGTRTDRQGQTGSTAEAEGRGSRRGEIVT